MPLKNPSRKSLRYYKVTTRRGHLGSGKGLDITFYIKAYQITDAVRQARSMPGVKHSKYISSAKEITLEEYLEGRTRSAYNVVD